MSELVFESLDYVYVPTADVDLAARRYVDELGAELVCKVRGMGTVVACLRVAKAGPGDPAQRPPRGRRADPDLPRRRLRRGDRAPARGRDRATSTSSRSRTGRARASTCPTGSGSRSTSSRGPRRRRASTAASTTEPPVGPRAMEEREASSSRRCPRGSRPRRPPGSRNSYLFEIKDAGTLARRRRRREGRPSPRATAEADVQLRHVRGDLPQARGRQQNPIRAVMTGKIKVKGDMGAATKLKTLLG